MCPCEEEDQTREHLIFQFKKLHTQRNEMIKQIKNTGGNWPMTDETLVNNYLQIFVKLVKSIDFTDLQQSFSMKDRQVDRSQRMYVNIINYVVPDKSYQNIPALLTNFVVLSYQNDGLTAIRFSLEKTLQLMVEFRCHRPKRFGKPNYSKDSRIRRVIV